MIGTSFFGAQSRGNVEPGLYRGSIRSRTTVSKRLLPGPASSPRSPRGGTSRTSEAVPFERIAEGSEDVRLVVDKQDACRPHGRRAQFGDVVDGRVQAESNCSGRVAGALIRRSQDDPCGCAPGWPGLDLQPSSDSVRDLSRDREAEAEAFRIPFTPPEEPVDDALCLSGRHPRAIVPHLDRNRAGPV